MRDGRNLAVLAGGLGLTVTLLSGGIFAVFTDRATTGLNDATTGALARSADLKLATASSDATFAGDPFNCGDFVDDLATGIISVSGFQSDNVTYTEVCLRNEGSAEVAVDMSVIDLVDLDVACTGDEAAAGDVTCGGNLVGEASQAMKVTVSRHNCFGDAPGTPLVAVETGLAANAQAPVAVPGSGLAPGETACFAFRFVYNPGEFGSVVAPQVMQSDEATWRYAFDGTTG